MNIKVIDNIFYRYHQAAAARQDIWCIHGFGASGSSFTEIFDSKLTEAYNIFVPDLPGFGASPPNPISSSLHKTRDLLLNHIEQISGKRKITIIAHSLGAIIGTWLCMKLKQKISSYINIEGNLTIADTFFSGIAAKAKSVEEFYTHLIENFAERAKTDESLRRYMASVFSADPKTLLEWGKEGVHATEKSGEEFKRLECKKIYIWGDKSAPRETIDFMKNNSIPNRCFEGSGHSPMIEQAEAFYSLASDFLSGSKVLIK